MQCAIILRRSKRKLFSINAWKIRLVFWPGALLVGCVAALFAMMATTADHSFAQLASTYPWLPFVLTPPDLC